MKGKNQNKKPVNTGKNRVERNEKGQIVSGSASLNPNGKPTGALSITALVKSKLQEIAPGATNAEKKTFIEMFILKIFHNAINKGDHQAQKMIWNYIDGMPKGSLDLTTGGKKLNTFDDKQLTAIARRILIDRGESEESSD